MKYFILCVFSLLLFSDLINAQVAGNVNYQSQVRYPDKNIDISYPNSYEIFVSVKGLANVKADTYVAIFNVSQVGKTTKEVNNLIDERINGAIKSIGDKEGLESYVDMISFVPVYEYEVEKKIFSKNTYNEIPVGFELKKNIHFKYTDPELLGEIITNLSNNEIYDLVRVDYFANDLEAVKKEMRKKSKTILQEKIADYQEIVKVNLDSIDKVVMDGFKMVLPVERYQSYQAYSSASLNLKRAGNVNQSDKTTTMYYQPIIDKEFDFVLNPSIMEPVIQVMYEIKVVVKREKVRPQVPIVKSKASEKEYILITPNGDIKKLDVSD